MRQGKPVFYWDSCVFLTLITNDRRDNDLIEGIENVVGILDKKRGYLVTSVMTETEVLESKMSPSAESIFQSVLKRSNVRKVNVDSKISALVRQIIDYYSKHEGRKLKPIDATHLATAIIYEVDELHTNDVQLLNIRSPICGKFPLRICRPPLPLQTNLQFPP
jgi:predicted nucleic acid-binding protein